MAITRSQIARQLMQEGGVPRQGYFLGKLVRKIKDDIIPNELKNPLGLAAAAVGANYLPTIIPGGSDKTLLSSLLGKIPESIKEGAATAIFGPKRKVTGIDSKGNPIYEDSRIGTEQRTGGILGNLLSSRVALPIASGLLAGAFTKDKEDPLYTGQDVGLNLQDIGKLANITDPRVGQAIGLRFLPDVEARKFTPAQMAETFAANQPVEFTEKREQAQDGGMMGDQKDFEEFLQDMQDRDKQMLQDRILQDF